MPVDRGHLRSMRLLPFAAAAGDLLTFWLQTSARKVYRGHSRRSGGQEWASKVCVGRCGCCILLLHHQLGLTHKRQQTGVAPSPLERRFVSCLRGVDRRRSRSVPRGWPLDVQPPGAEGWEATAAAWLMDRLPEYRHYPTVREHPVVLAFIARHVLAGAVEGARQGYRTTRTELRGLVCPPRDRRCPWRLP